MEATTVGVIGAGTMGAGIAQVFLGAGATVLLHDASEEQLQRAAARVRDGLRKWEEKGRIPSTEEAAARLTLCPGLIQVELCDWIIEAIVEEREAKAEVFRTLGRLCRPEAVLASNTSSISITFLGRESGRPEQTLGM